MAVWVAVGLLNAALILICTYAAMQHDKRHVTLAQIRWRAHYENWLNKIGHPAGTHGRYPPWRF
jgi:hypothetical protein